MTDFWKPIIKWIAGAVMIGVIFAASINRSTHYDFRLCQLANENRRSDNIRAGVLREFLTTAEEARRRSARLEAKAGDAMQATLDLQTAEHYKTLRGRIVDLEILDCHETVTQGAQGGTDAIQR